MRSSRSRLTKLDILRGYRTFSRVIAEGRCLHHAPVRCFYLADRTMGGAVRVGFSVSRGVRTAVERNRGRRWMRETYRRNKSLLVGSPPSITGEASVVFLLRTRGGVALSREFRKSLDQAMVVLLKELHHQLTEQL